MKNQAVTKKKDAKNETNYSTNDQYRKDLGQKETHTERLDPSEKKASYKKKQERADNEKNPN
jgi:hypothetical protein